MGNLGDVVWIIVGIAVVYVLSLIYALWRDDD